MFMTGTSWGASEPSVSARSRSVCCYSSGLLAAPLVGLVVVLGVGWILLLPVAIAPWHTHVPKESSTVVVDSVLLLLLLGSPLSLPADGKMETGVFPPDMNDSKLLLGVVEGNLGLVKAAMQAGANVNGCPTQPCTPIVNATIGYYVDIVQFLLERGADPDRPVLTEISGAKPGERALHIAGREGKAEIVRLLLGAGADPTLEERHGFTPLHYVALRGHVELVDMVYSRAPAVLNRRAAQGQTPLLSACAGGHDNMVSKLLSLGAMQVAPEDLAETSPLMMATCQGYEGVVRVLVNEGGIWFVGGGEGLAQALYMAIRFRRTRILPLLLAADGEENQYEWANTINDGGISLLHEASSFCYPAAVSLLLEAGANEGACDPQGRIPGDLIGVELEKDGARMDPKEKLAVSRMLQRGPAYRAQSWAWPSEEGAVAGSSGDGNTTAAAAAAAADAADAAVLSSSPVVRKSSPVVGVRIFRPKDSSASSTLFLRLIGRYCAKD